MAWTKQTGTKHKEDCKRVFNRYDPTCPRCQELMNGEKPRDGWNSKSEDMRRAMEIRNHDCKKSGCGPVCTFGDW